MLPLSGPPRKLTLSQVPTYIRTRYGYEITKRTARNWVFDGKRGIKLKTVVDNVKNKKGGPHAKISTMTMWVDEFLKAATEIV